MVAGGAVSNDGGPNLSFSEDAKRRLRPYFQTADASLALRVEVYRQNCGVSYLLTLDATLGSEDVDRVIDGIPVRALRADWMDLSGATVEYVQELSGEGFRLVHPSKPSCC